MKVKLREYKLQVVTFKDGLPENIRGLLTDGGDGKFIIAIDGRLSRERQLATFLHEAVHLWRGDLDRDDDMTVDQIENQVRQDLMDAMTVMFQ